MNELNSETLSDNDDLEHKYSELAYKELPNNNYVDIQSSNNQYFDNHSTYQTNTTSSSSDVSSTDDTIHISDSFFDLNVDRILNNNQNNIPSDNDINAGLLADDENIFPFISFINNLSFWEFPVFDHTSWFCIGLYLVLMIIVPIVKDGSTSIIFALNIPVMFTYILWCSWYARTTANECLKWVSAGFFIMGSISFILGIAIYYFIGIPTDVYCYYTSYASSYYQTYTLILECFIVAFLIIGIVQSYSQYYMVSRAANLDFLDVNHVHVVGQIIGACVGIGVGQVLCVNTMSIILFDLQWQSRIELWFIRNSWALVLSVCTSYLIGCGTAERQIMRYPLSIFSIIGLPVLYITFCYFQFLILMVLHTSIFIRFGVLIASAIMNFVVCSAAMIEVWQRHNFMKGKQSLWIRSSNRLNY